MKQIKYIQLNSTNDNGLRSQRSLMILIYIYILTL